MLEGMFIFFTCITFFVIGFKLGKLEKKVEDLSRFKENIMSHIQFLNQSFEIMSGDLMEVYELRHHHED